MRTPSITLRQRDTILAALRYWQHVKGYELTLLPEYDIAADSGPPLDDQQIDVLCERLNGGG